MFQISSHYRTARDRNNYNWSLLWIAECQQNCVQLRMKINVSAAYPRTGQHDFTSSDKDLHLNFHRCSTVFCYWSQKWKYLKFVLNCWFDHNRKYWKIIKNASFMRFPNKNILGGFKAAFRLPYADVTQLSQGSMFNNSFLSHAFHNSINKGFHARKERQVNFN